MTRSALDCDALRNQILALVTAKPGVNRQTDLLKMVAARAGEVHRMVRQLLRDGVIHRHAFRGPLFPGPADPGRCSRCPEANGSSHEGQGASQSHGAKSEVPIALCADRSEGSAAAPRDGVVRHRIGERRWAAP